MVRESAKAEKSNNFSIKRVLRKRAFNLPSVRKVNEVKSDKIII